MNSTGKLRTALCAAGAFCLLIAMLFSSLRIVLNDEGRHAREYERLDVAAAMGMSDEDILRSLMKLVDYMEGRTDDIRLTVEVFGESVVMFNERETLHMVDVRELYLAWKTASYVLFALAAAAFACVALVERKRSLHTLCAGYVWGFCALGGVGACIAAWAAADFSSFWTSFHLLFFSNDLWLLDPRTSRMINMFPQDFFSNIILQFALLFLIPALLLLLLAAAHMIIHKRRAAKE
ncbi:MAG: TIGR01906 family membrane protein [Clostridia bacterium]|nr:TIGR01906 family membrane protein [Clostridia bacterium]